MLQIHKSNKSEIPLSKFEIKPYFCAVNQEVPYFNISISFHGALNQAIRFNNPFNFFNK